MTTKLTQSFSAATKFVARLRQLSDDVLLEEGRFPARNFRLETALALERCDSYLLAGDLALSGHSSADQMAAWNEHHERYLNEHVRSGARSDSFQAGNPATPETFRFRNEFDEFGHAGDELDLVRLDDLGRIARVVSEPPDDVRALAVQVAEGRRANGRTSAAPARDLDDILRIWQDARDLDNRPIFAGFWEDAAEVLEDPAPGWANDVRNRLGLAQYDPERRLRRRGIDVLAFRYSVGVVPRMRRSPVRFLARPTVLDGALSAAFCTAPPGSGRGCALDLAGRAEDPWQEVVHPAVTFLSEHVWAVGTITSPVPEDLTEARGFHYTALCDGSNLGFEELVEETDSDLW